jgi:glycosyltransferase involved in cell wall biosynthesis
MKIVQFYNNYKSGGGGETVMAHTSADVLRRHGHIVTPFWRDNRDINGITDKIKVFFSGVYSRAAYRATLELIEHHRPDAVLAFNLYPQLSPSVIEACWASEIPVLLSVQNHQMTCPTAAHFIHGEVCNRCIQGSELHCVTNNCKGDMLQSAAYALRSAVARKAGWFRNHVTTFLVISEAVRMRMLEAGYDDSRIRILPNAVPVPEVVVDPSAGRYVGFLGRLAKEKGLGVLLEAAEKTNVPLHIAGNGEELFELQARAPKNVTFVGWIGREEVSQFYRHSRFTIVPSLWPEPFGLVATEAMSYGLPVIAARSGALPEIVTHEQNGLLYNARDSGELATQLQRLWDNPIECARLGANARETVRTKYSETAYYTQLNEALEDAVRRRTGFSREQLVIPSLS